MKKASSSAFGGAALVVLAACATQNRDIADIAAQDAGVAPPPSGCAQDCSKVVTVSCFKGSCNELTGKCEIAPSPDGTACDDGLFCTVGETCTHGVCGNAKPNLCGQTECLEGICDEQTRQCMLTARADETPCTVQGDACAVGATCQSGQCVGTPKDCSYAPGIDECHTATCNPATGKCEVAPGNDLAPCHAQYNCWVDQTCWKGVCQGGYSLDHSGGSSTGTTGCGESICNPQDGTFTGKTVPVGSQCDPFFSGAGYECITGTCEQGNQCVPTIKVGASCPSVEDDCSYGTCDQAAHCAPLAKNEGAACDDRDFCTTGATCQQGSCKGSLKSGVTVYFKDDFGSGSLSGWTREMGTTSAWVVQPAVSIDQQTESASGAAWGPEKDHTATMDQEMLAGVAGAVGDFVDSPSIDLSAAKGSVWLTVWIVGQTQADKNLAISIFDGTQWSDVWVTTLDAVVTEWAWTPVIVDVTNFKSANFKVRFGFEIGPNPPGIVPGIPYWAPDSLFVDDLSLSSQPCAPTTGTSGGGGGGSGG